VFPLVSIYLRNGLILLGVLIVAGQQISTVDARPLAGSAIAADHNQVQGVADALAKSKMTENVKK
jgi:hypothetical protein